MRIGKVSNCSAETCENSSFARGLCRKHYMRWWTHGDENKVLKVMPETGAVERFIEESISYSGTDCINWPFNRNNKGYAIVKNGLFHGTLVSRLICERINGKPPTEEHHALHSCGFGHLGCITPNHIRWGTRLDNSIDMIKHGRATRGTVSPNSKLNDEQVQEIYRRVHGGEVQTELADEFGVSQ